MILFKPSNVFVDAIINHPGCRATIQQGRYRLESAGVLSNPENVVLAYDQGVAIFEGLGRGVYQGHICTLPTSRGREALAFGRLAVTKLFHEHRAAVLTARVPMQLPAARFYCRRLGLKPEGRDLFDEIFTMECDKWAV
jgi:hypothetical protein